VHRVTRRILERIEDSRIYVASLYVSRNIVSLLAYFVYIIDMYSRNLDTHSEIYRDVFASTNVLEMPKKNALREVLLIVSRLVDRFDDYHRADIVASEGYKGLNKRARNAFASKMERQLHHAMIDDSFEPSFDTGRTMTPRSISSFAILRDRSTKA